MTTQIYKKDNGLLYFSNGKEETEVFIKPLFPWSSPDTFISLRDDKDKEVYLIEDFVTLDSEEIKVVKESLKEMEFTMDIISIDSIEEDIELRRFEVQLSSGKRQFQTKLDVWPRIAIHGAIYIEDIFGDLYVIQRPSDLDAKSFKKLSPYLT